MQARYWFYLFLIVLAIAVLPQLPTYVMVNAPKTGRVVDSTTGRGLPNVTVVAAATYNASGLIHGSAYLTLYRIITTTDADGNFEIPSTWTSFGIGIPGTDARERWFITAIKLGYVLERDQSALSKFDEYGAPAEIPSSIAESPPATWLGYRVRVDPLRMKPMSLSLKEAAVYYSSLKGVGGFAVGNPKDEASLRTLGAEWFLPQVCELDTDEVMDMTTGGKLVMFSTNPDESAKRLRQLEPSGFGDLQQHTILHAGNVCSAMKAGGDAP